MKFSTKAGYLVGCSVAAILGSASALAVLPPNLGGPAAPDFVFYFGGGSAEPQAIAVATCNLMNNVDVYTSTPGGLPDSTAYLVMYGTTINANGNVPAGKNVMVMYKFNGGSLPNGGVPQDAATTTGLPYPTVASVLAAGDVATGAPAFCTPGNGKPTIQVPALYSTTLGPNVQPAFGLTDLETTAFTGINNPIAPTTVHPGAQAGIYDLVFGIAASSALFQQKQNFSYAEVQGILSGRITNWSGLYGDQPGFLNTPLPAGNIILLDRNVGSGHKTSSTAEFLGYPQLGSLSVQPNSTAGTGYVGGVQPANVGASPVDCGAEFQDINEGSAAATVQDFQRLINPISNVPAGCGLSGNAARAIAILSMDNPPAVNQVAGANAYDFVSLHGTWVDGHVAGVDDENGNVATSYSNVIKGNYTWVYQANFNTLTPGYLTSHTADGSSDMAAAYLAQLKSVTLPGCSGSPGLAFPGNMSGVVIDVDNVAAMASCVTTSTRNRNSDKLPFPKVVPGNIQLGSEPL